MDAYRIALIPGDGVGGEITDEAVRVLGSAADIDGFEITRVDGSAATIELDSPVVFKIEQSRAEEILSFLGFRGLGLDAVDDARFRDAADVDFPVARVLEGIDAAKDAGLTPIKINGRSNRYLARLRALAPNVIGIPFS